MSTHAHRQRDHIKGIHASIFINIIYTTNDSVTLCILISFFRVYGNFLTLNGKTAAGFERVRVFVALCTCMCVWECNEDALLAVQLKGRSPGQPQALVMNEGCLAAKVLIGSPALQAHDATRCDKQEVVWALGRLQRDSRESWGPEQHNKKISKLWKQQHQDWKLTL